MDNFYIDKYDIYYYYSATQYLGKVSYLGEKMRIKLIILFMVIFSFSTQITIGQPQNDIEKKFNFAYGSLKDVHKGYVTDVMKALAFLILCIGWFITSDKSRNFFKKNRIVRI